MSVNEQEIADVTRAAVREAMAEKDEVDRLSKIEELLGNAEAEVTTLTEALATKETELSTASEERDSLATQLEELKTETEKLKEALSAASEEKEALEERASTAEVELASIEAEKCLAARMSELEEAKVVKSGEKRAAQEDKIRGLSDEEFAAYKEELVDFRTEWEAENAAAEEDAAADDGAEDDASGDDVEVDPPDVERAQAEEAAAAAAATLNIEVASEDMVSKYLAMANKMAADMSGSQE